MLCVRQHTNTLKSLIGSMFLLATLSACTEPTAEPQPSPIIHQTASLELSQQSEFSIERSFVGSVFAQQNASVGFELAGKISEIYINEGDRVQQGQTLAQLDTELLLIERDELKAQISQTDADLGLVFTNLKRLNSLKTKGYTSEQSVDELEFKKKSLYANKKRLNASLHANQTKIKKSTLLAPFDAIVGEKMVAEGQVVSTGLATFKLLQRGVNEVKVGVPVRLLAQLEQDTQQKVAIAGTRYPVALLTKGAQVDPITRTVQLRFSLPEGARVVAGQLAYLYLQETHQQDGYWIPLTALTDGIRGLWNVYVLKDSGENIYTLESRDVQIAYATRDSAYVYGALEQGERIIAMGMHRLVPGQRVKTHDWQRDKTARAAQ